jgi:hypothetical protein
MELEAAKGRDKKSAEDRPVEKPRCFITTKMATAYPEVSSEMVRFFLKVQKLIVI